MIEQHEAEVRRKHKCTFCKIVNGRLPAATILETDRLLVIVAKEDGYPLIVTKKHFRNLADPNLDDETAKEIGLIQRDMTRLVSSIGNIDVSVLANNGPQAGQEVFHLHIHVMPRIEGDRTIRIRVGATLSLEELHTKAAFYKQAMQNLWSH